MKKGLVILILILGISSFQTVGFGKETTKGVKGEIAAVDVVAKSLRILPEGQLEKKEEGVNIIVLADTQFNGFDSLAELKVGDEISAEVQLNEKTQLWEARSIVLVKVALRDTAL